MKVINRVIARTDTDNKNTVKISTTVMIQLLRDDIVKRIHTIIHTHFVNGKRLYWERTTTEYDTEKHQLLKCTTRKDVDIISIEEITRAVDEFYNTAINGGIIFNKVIITDFKNKIEETGKTFENVSIYIRSKNGRYEGELHWIELIYMACVDISNEYDVTLVNYPISSVSPIPAYSFQITKIPYKTVPFVLSKDIEYPEFPNSMVANIDKPQVKIDDTIEVGISISVAHGLDYGIDVVSLQFIQKPKFSRPSFSCPIMEETLANIEDSKIIEALKKIKLGLL